jgi:Ca2+-binding RTX toxin-like protein
MLESLESRRLMTTTLEDGVLTIRGSDIDDNVMVWQPLLETMRIEHNGAVAEFATSDVTAIYVNVYGGNDQVVLGRRTVNAIIIGGEGNDTLSAGEGNDTICGDGGNDYLFGGGGHDYLNGGDGTGDDGDDLLGGTGWDTVDYSARVNSVRIGIGKNFNDGEVDEHDNVREGVDIVIGGSGDDMLMNFTAFPAKLYGVDGNDLLIGSGENDTLSGGAGEDELQGAGGFDSFLAKDGEPDVIIAGTGLDGDIEKDLLDDVRAA